MRLLIAASVWNFVLVSMAAQTAAPVFTAKSVGPVDTVNVRKFEPGMLVSIYGFNLGPEAACDGKLAQRCGTTVEVNGVGAELLYVHQRQINLRLPSSVSGDGKLAVTVIANGGSSSVSDIAFVAPPLPEKPVVEIARISLIGRAYVRMPIWIAVELPGRHQGTVRYPITSYPEELRGHDLEVRRNGKPLAKILVASPGGRSGSGPGSSGSIGGGGLIGLEHEPQVVGRLPLHLLYRFEAPGRYQVRYTGYDAGFPRRAVLAQSEWLTIQVEAISERQRSVAFERLQQSAPGDSVEMLSEYLPEVLAWRDGKALAVIKQALNHKNALVQSYARNALGFFKDP